MRILVIGAGAVGGYFGGRLLQAGRDITFLVREPRAAQLRSGLHILSPHGNVTLEPTLLTAAELAAAPQTFDLILIGTKAYSLASAIDDFAPAVGPNTILVPLLNGMRHLDDLSARFTPTQVLGGSVRIIGDLPDGNIVEQKTELGELTFGPRASVPGQSSAYDFPALFLELSAPGIVTLMPPDALVLMWQKWWILASMNITCILAGGSLGQAASAPGGPEFLQAALNECTSIAERNGYPPLAPMMAEHQARLADRTSPLTTSMFRDMARGYPVEADHIFGDLLARAKGVPTPLLQAAYIRTKIYQSTQGRSGQ